LLTKKQAKKQAEHDKTSSDKIKKEKNEAIAKLEALKNNDVELEKYYLSEWRTFQMSDHFPLWVVLETDFTDKYLDSLIN